MSSKILTGGDKLQAYLDKIASGNIGTLKVGFQNGASYPNGEKVAAVAFINEFGAGKIPARPFFRPMIAHESKHWGAKIGKLLAADFDPNKALGAMGMVIEGDLAQSIINVQSPALSPITLMMRKMKSENASGTASYSEAIKRVQAGESTAGVSTKPLIETSHMLNSITSEVS